MNRIMRRVIVALLCATFFAFTGCKEEGAYIESATDAIVETTVTITPTIEPTSPPTTEATVAPIEQTEQPTEPEIVYSIDTPETDLELLACVIYREAGSNSICDKCRYYVGDVVLNRVELGYWGDSIYDVLTAPSQYGPFANGVSWGSRAQYEEEAVVRAYKVAEDLLNGKHSEIYGNNYIWQAGFVQGKGGFWCCRTYFGYS